MDYIGQGNGINKRDGEKLLFRLGIIEGGKLVSSAEITDEIAKGIAVGADNQINAELNITVPFHPENGTSWNWSFAC